LQEEVEGGESGGDVVAAVFNVLVRLLWRYRESVLRPSQKLIPVFPRAKAPGSKGSSSSSQQIYTSAELDQLGDLVRQWLQELSKETGVKKILVTHRLGPLMPQAARDAAEAYEAATGKEDMIPVLEAFECYIFDFLVSPTGASNNSRFQQSRIRHIAEEIVFYTYELIPAIKRVTPVASLYAEMIQVVHSFPQLAYARFWSDIPIITYGPQLYLPLRDENSRLVSLSLSLTCWNLSSGFETTHHLGAGPRAKTQDHHQLWKLGLTIESTLQFPKPYAPPPTIIPYYPTLHYICCDTLMHLDDLSFLGVLSLFSNTPPLTCKC
jgi:hypothetical protein